MRISDWSSDRVLFRSDLGNDREARVEPAPTTAPIMHAQEALQNVATAIIRPETMSNADVQALGGRQGRCAVVLTEVAFPSFLYLPQGSGAIKLNGKLIVLPRTGEKQFADGGLSVTLRSVAEKGAAGLPARSEAHTSELQSLMRIPYAIFCLKK